MEPAPQVVPFAELITKGNAEVMLAKQKINEGREAFETANMLRGTAEQSVTILSNSSSLFTEASEHFKTALTYYNEATPQAPSGMKDSLAIMTSMLPTCPRRH